MSGFLIRVAFASSFLYSGVVTFMRPELFASSTAQLVAGLRRTPLGAALPSSLPFSWITYFCLGCELMGAAAMLSAGGELCGTVMLAVFVAVSALTQHLPLVSSHGAWKVDESALPAFLADVTMLGALLLIFGLAFDRKYGSGKKAKAH